jgi:cell wall-associated NlpC family hydrolase
VKAALAGAGSLLLLPVLVIAAALGATGQSEPSPTALSDIPAAYLTLYQQAASQFAIPWPILAAIGKVETDHGRNPDTNTPNPEGAPGPMQFLPATFAAYSWASGSRNPNIDNPEDAIFAAAALLAANDVRDNPRQAIYDYNHSEAYVDQVLAWAAAYQAADGSPSEAAPPSVGTPTKQAEAAVDFAFAQLGTPYLWGGDGPGGFDCSGLVQAAYASAGIELPRIAQAQFDVGPAVPPGTPLQAGDLVFFGTDTTHIDHVGILVNQTEMIDAPHTGALVRIEPYGWPDYLGATRPIGRLAEPDSRNAPLPGAP